jgi:hypothetical protein
MMDRRGFLKLTGLIAAASALDVVPVAAASHSHATLAEPARDLGAATAATVTRLAIREPGMYQVSGLVRLESPLVEISGIANAQQISWSGAESAEPRVASFVSFEQVDRWGAAPSISVRGGRLESLSVVPVVFE